MKIESEIGGYGKTQYKQFRCFECGTIIGDQYSSELAHPTTERYGFLWLKERPVACEFRGVTCPTPREIIEVEL